MISIIIPLYSQAKELRKCLESIQAQSYDNYEIIVINDRSTDSLSKLHQWSKKTFQLNIEWVHNTINHGAPYSRNKGLRKAKGEYLLFCDADLILHPHALEIMYNTLQKNPEASYAYPSHKHGHKLFKLWPFDAEKLKTMPYIHSTALVRREHFPKKGWDESLKRLQDWDIWLTMLEKGYKGVWIDQVLFTIQGGGHTMSSWLPSAFYKLFPFLPKVKKYEEAVRVVKGKHNLL
jgi:glycosyltransferase EpsE